ncbi:hypothetical protein E4U42_000849 [Claviceps africana]|uniref:Uncharacterized protein n=1 Tax=Claviceps africana TaxID=83212 RepID=A0A8K0J0B5_9HYPO|nr:hypothetical protein E4U42_000849 [Claviceps africana]
MSPSAPALPSNESVVGAPWQECEQEPRIPLLTPLSIPLEVGRPLSPGHFRARRLLQESRFTLLIPQGSPGLGHFQFISVQLRMVCVLLPAVAPVGTRGEFSRFSSLRTESSMITDQQISVRRTALYYILAEYALVAFVLVVNQTGLDSVGASETAFWPEHYGIKPTESAVKLKLLRVA